MTTCCQLATAVGLGTYRQKISAYNVGLHGCPVRGIARRQSTDAWRSVAPTASIARLKDDSFGLLKCCLGCDRQMAPWLIKDVYRSKKVNLRTVQTP